MATRKVLALSMVAILILLSLYFYYPEPAEDAGVPVSAGIEAVYSEDGMPHATAVLLGNGTHDRFRLENVSLPGLLPGQYYQAWIFAYDAGSLHAGLPGRGRHYASSKFLPSDVPDAFMQDAGNVFDLLDNASEYWIFITMEPPNDPDEGTPGATAVLAGKIASEEVQLAVPLNLSGARIRGGIEHGRAELTITGLPSASDYGLQYEAWAVGGNELSLGRFSADRSGTTHFSSDVEISAGHSRFMVTLEPMDEDYDIGPSGIVPFSARMEFVGPKGSLTG